MDNEEVKDPCEECPFNDISCLWQWCRYYDIVS